MTGPPSLYAMGKVFEQRQAEFQAEAARESLGRLAQGKSNRRQRRADFSAVVVVMILGLLLAAGIAMTGVSPSSDGPLPEHADARAVMQVLDEHFLGPGAARKDSMASL